MVILFSNDYAKRALIHKEHWHARRQAGRQTVSERGQLSELGSILLETRTCTSKRSIPILTSLASPAHLQIWVQKVGPRVALHGKRHFAFGLVIRSWVAAGEQKE